jgi:hypothetical protein
MAKELTVQGRRLGDDDLDAIRGLVAEHADWSRYRLSRELAMAWDWRNAAGQLKDIACRSLMRKLEARGLIELPACRRESPNRFRHREVERVGCEAAPYRGVLRGLQPLSVHVVKRGSDASLFASLLAEHHYLGYRQPVGENLQYLLRAADGRPVACLLFGSASWRCGARDRFIGWDDAARAAGLCKVTNNHRFLILPWLEVPHLASHALGLVARRVQADWQEHYGHGPLLLETFVDRSRFRGTCYRAANWVNVGQTKGRSRQDRHHRLSVSIKDLYMYALAPKARERLRTDTGPESCPPKRCPTTCPLPSAPLADAAFVRSARPFHTKYSSRWTSNCSGINGRRLRPVVVAGPVLRPQTAKEPPTLGTTTMKQPPPIRSWLRRCPRKPEKSLARPDPLPRRPPFAPGQQCRRAQLPPPGQTPPQLPRLPQ